MKNNRKIKGYNYKMTQVLVDVGPRIQISVNSYTLGVHVCVCQSHCACLLHTACLPCIVVYIILYLKNIITCLSRTE